MKMEELADRVANSHPSLARGQVWCRSCGSTRKGDSAQCFLHDWPKCCGSTMTIDSPEEQAAYRRQSMTASRSGKRA